MRNATLSDKPFILDILTRAFDGNRSVNYVVKQDGHRVQRIRDLMDYSFKMCNDFGEVWIDDDRKACALILFPDQQKTSLKTILWDLALAISVIGVNRVTKIMKRESDIKKHHPKEPFAYLWFLGVDPGMQGNGIGSEFLTEIIKECEKKKRSIYLETSMENNIPFYRKFGFEIFESLRLTYTLYMLRRV